MNGRKIALLVATDRYQDAGLSRLTAPATDARKLAAVLSNPAISGFEVTQLHNRPNAEVGKAIGNFYRDRKRDDLTCSTSPAMALKTITASCTWP